MNSNIIKRIVLLTVILAAIVAFFLFDLGHYFNLQYLKSSRESLFQFYNNNKVIFIAFYMLIYIVTTALSLPGAAVMTLAGGAILGFVTGTIVVSFASTIGATLALIAARFLLRDWVQKKFGERLRAVNEGIEREGPFYLFTLRLVPIFPFFVINLVMGLTPMRVRTFYWVSQVGMLPGTMVYVFAGRELGRIDSLSGIMSPTLWISFILLGTFPLIVKKLMNLYRSRKAPDG